MWSCTPEPWATQNSDISFDRLAVWPAGLFNTVKGGIPVENLMISLNCVTPIFIYMLVGWYASVRRVVPREVFSRISRLAFSVLLPFTMFNNIYSADLDASFPLPMVVYLLAVNIVFFTVGSLILFRTEPNGRRRGLSIQNIYRSNIAIIGVALAQPLMSAEALSAMCIAIAVLVPVYNVLAIIALELCRGRKVSTGKLLVSMVKNPLIFGSVTGILFSALGIRLPSPVESAVAGLAKTGSVIAVVALGANFEFSALRRNVRPLTKLALNRLVVYPLLMVAPAVLLGFRGSDLATILICVAAPISTSTYTMALVYDSDDELSGQTVIITSLFCCVTLFLWIFLFKQLGLF